VIVACDKEEVHESTADKPDAGAVNRTAQVDPSLAKAVAAASAKPAAATGDAAGGPPPSGIFDPGEADKQIKKGAPAIVTIGSAGNQPRVKLRGSHFVPGSKQKGVIQVAVQSDPRQPPLPIDFEMSFEAQAVPAAEGAGSNVPTKVVAKVESAKYAVTGVPAQMAVEVGNFKGSRVEYEVGPNGAAQNFTPIVSKAAEQAKGNQSQGAQSFQALNDALATITIPYPDDPVGNGAFWMATTREGVMGLDLVTYRMIKVTRATPEQVTLTIGTKRYAADTSFNIPGLPENYTLAEFQSAADGTMMLTVGQPVPHQALLKLNLGALLIPANNPDEQGQLQVQGQARFTFPGAAAEGQAAPAGATAPAPRAPAQRAPTPPAGGRPAAPQAPVPQAAPPGAGAP
jgi:hypothetical protein